MIGVHTIESAEVGKLYEIRWDNHRTWSREQIFYYDFPLYDSNLVKISPRRVTKITSGTPCVLLKHKGKYAFLLVGDEIIALEHEEEGFELFPITAIP